MRSIKQSPEQFKGVIEALRSGGPSCRPFQSIAHDRVERGDSNESWTFPGPDRVCPGAAGREERILRPRRGATNPPPNLFQMRSGCIFSFLHLSLTFTISVSPSSVITPDRYFSGVLSK